MENIENYFIVYLIEVGQLHEKNTKENTEKRSGLIDGLLNVWPNLRRTESVRTNVN